MAPWTLGHPVNKHPRQHSAPFALTGFRSLGLSRKCLPDRRPWTREKEHGERRQTKSNMDMVADLGANRLYRAPGESSHQWVSMGFCRGGGGITAWGVSGSCRHLMPGKESLGLGSRQILPAARSAPDLRREVGVVLRKKAGVLARLIPACHTLRESIYLSARGTLSCWRFVSIFLLCAGWSLKWASLQDRLGCSGAPLPAFLSQDCSTLVSFCRSAHVWIKPGIAPLGLLWHEERGGVSRPGVASWVIGRCGACQQTWHNE